MGWLVLNGIFITSMGCVNLALNVTSTDKFEFTRCVNLALNGPPLTSLNARGNSSVGLVLNVISTDTLNARGV